MLGCEHGRVVELGAYLVRGRLEAVHTVENLSMKAMGRKLQRKRWL
jgi:hypothetical protein